MPLVVAPMVTALVEPLAGAGLPLERWIEGTGLLPEQVRAPGRSIPWRDCIELVDRAARHLGGPDELEAFIVAMEPDANKDMLSLFGAVMPSERMIATLVEFLISEASPPLQIGMRWRRRFFAAELCVDRGQPASKAFFQVLRGVLRRAPQQWGVAEFELESSIEERCARFEVRFEPVPWLARLPRLLQSFGAARQLTMGLQSNQRRLRSTLRQMEGQASALRESEARTRELTEQVAEALAVRTRELEARRDELRELQSRLVQAERLGAAHELAGSVAHAINNPLTALIGQVQMMLESVDPTPARLERLHRVAQRIREVVTRTLQLFRQGGLDLAVEEPQRLLDEVAAVLRPLAERADVRIEVKCEAAVPLLEVDGPLLRAALTSLAENAIEASPAGGTVELEFATIDSLQVAEFRVSDAGPGVPPELRIRVLEPFFTTKPSGTGLGLAIANGVIAGHGGRLRLLPRPGGGTTAAVELLLATDPDGVSARAS
jgi:signal transduction histidine kinase